MLFRMVRRAHQRSALYFLKTFVIFLRGGGLDNCQFTNVEFEHCNLVEAEFHRTSLKGIDLTSSEIAGIRIGSIPGGELKGATVTSLQALDIARMLGITIKD